VTKNIKIHLPFVSSPMDTVRRAVTLLAAGPKRRIAVLWAVWPRFAAGD